MDISWKWKSRQIGRDPDQQQTRFLWADSWVGRVKNVHVHISDVKCNSSPTEWHRWDIVGLVDGQDFGKEQQKRSHPLKEDT